MLLIYLEEVERCTTEQEADCTVAPCMVAHFIKLLYPSIFLAKDAHIRDGPRLLHKVWKTTLLMPGVFIIVTMRLMCKTFECLKTLQTTVCWSRN